MGKGPARTKEIEDPAGEWQFRRKMWLVLGGQILLMSSQIHLEPNMSLLLWPRSLPGLRSTGLKLKDLFPF